MSIRFDTIKPLGERTYILRSDERQATYEIGASDRPSQNRPGERGRTGLERHELAKLEENYFVAVIIIASTNYPRP